MYIWKKCALLCLILGSANLSAQQPAYSLTLHDRTWFREFVSHSIDSNTPRNHELLSQIDARRDLLSVFNRWRNVEWRAYAQVIGQGAFAFRTATPANRWFGNSQLLTALHLGFEDFASTQDTTSGRLNTSDCQECGHFAHEAAWRLEPLLNAFFWIESTFSDTQRSRYETMLRRACVDLKTRRATTCNNQGSVWMTVVSMCGTIFPDPDYINLLHQYADYTVRCSVDEQGQLFENEGGPDANYSYVTFPYLYFYSKLTDDQVVKAALVPATQWAVQYISAFSDVLVSGSAVRRPDFRGESWSLVPALEQLSADDPFYAWLSDRYIINDRPTFGNFGYGGVLTHPLIWALLQPRGAEPRDNPPSWYSNFTEVYRNVGSLVDQSYMLIARPNYRTGLAFRTDEIQGNQANILRGLQTYALEGELPILHHYSWYNYNTILSHSKTIAGGIDTTLEDVTRIPSGNGSLDEYFVKTGSAPAEWNGVAPTTVITRQRSLWTLYAYTPVSLVVVYGGVNGPYHTEWSTAMQPTADISQPQKVLFHGSSGRIYYLGAAPTLSSKPSSHLLSFEVAQGPAAYAFSDSSFQDFVADSGNQRITFRDSAGSCSISLSNVLSGNNIDRNVGQRLVCSGNVVPARPLLSFPAGKYNQPFSLAITSRTPNVTIRYNLDGSEPTLASTVYTAPLNISTTTLLRCKAFDSNGRESGETQAFYAVDNLLLHINFESSATATFNDASRSLNHAALEGSATFGTGGPRGRFIQLNNSGYVRVPNRYSQNFGLDDFSISAWFQSNQIGNYQVIVSKGSTRTVDYAPHFFLRLEGDGHIKFLTSGSRDSQYSQNETVSRATLRNDGQWHHVLVVRQAQSQRLYLDGVLDSETQGGFAAQQTSGNDILIGARFENGVLDQFRGSIDDLRFYGRALADVEVNAIYNGSTVASPPSAPEGLRIR